MAIDKLEPAAESNLASEFFCEWDHSSDILRLHIAEVRCVGQQFAGGLTIFREVVNRQPVGFSVLCFSECLQRLPTVHSGQLPQAVAISDLVDHVLQPALSLQAQQRRDLLLLVRHPLFAGRLIPLAASRPVVTQTQDSDLVSSP